MEVNIRIAKPADLPSLYFLDAECFPKGNLDLEPAPPGEIDTGVAEGWIFVAETSGEVIGMLQFEKADSTQWNLLTLAIGSQHRAKGVGKALLKRLVEELDRTAYLVTISCLTSPNNLAMQQLLESFGFFQVGLLLDHYGPGKDRLKFVLG